MPIHPVMTKANRRLGIAPTFVARCIWKSVATTMKGTPESISDNLSIARSIAVIALDRAVYRADHKVDHGYEHGYHQTESDAVRNAESKVVTLAVGAHNIVGLKAVGVYIVVVIQQSDLVLRRGSSAAAGIFPIDGVSVFVALVVVLELHIVGQADSYLLTVVVYPDRIAALVRLVPIIRVERIHVVFVAVDERIQDFAPRFFLPFDDLRVFGLLYRLVYKTDFEISVDPCGIDRSPRLLLLAFDLENGLHFVADAVGKSHVARSVGIKRRHADRISAYQTFFGEFAIRASVRETYLAQGRIARTFLCVIRVHERDVVSEREQRHEQRV